MQPFTIVEALPTAEDYNRLRLAVGWRAHPIALVEAALPRSLFGVCAWVDEQVVGMARVIGDDGLAYYIQDVVVLPEYQRQGIGARLMDAVMAYIHAHAEPDTAIGLMAAYGKESFYQKYGFIRRPNEKYGAGMTFLWGI